MNGEESEQKRERESEEEIEQRERGEKNVNQAETWFLMFLWLLIAGGVIARGAVSVFAN